MFDSRPAIEMAGKSKLVHQIEVWPFIETQDAVVRENLDDAHQVPVDVNGRHIDARDVVWPNDLDRRVIASIIGELCDLFAVAVFDDNRIGGLNAVNSVLAQQIKRRSRLD